MSRHADWAGAVEFSKWEDWRVISRYCPSFLFVMAGLVAALTAGCTDAFNSGPLSYIESNKLATELKDSPELQVSVRKALVNLFGPDPTHIKVPEGAGYPNGGLSLGSFRDEGNGMISRIAHEREVDGAKVTDRQIGGYGLYRQHCLHCHGVSGAGDGPTSTFLFPRPRDYRLGVYKFTSTPTGAKPARADLRKTIREGLSGTSMPAFEVLMSAPEIEQVLDYMIFLGQRGEVELALINEAAASGELPDDIVADISKSIFDKWISANQNSVDPPSPRVATSPESITRGRDLFLGVNTVGTKVVCTTCHGLKGQGDGTSFVNEDVFNDIVFGGDPSTMNVRLKNYDEKTQDLWKNSLDDWSQPLRPANLNKGIFKGGRRPIDLYWRIAKGINGAKMPAHYPAIDSDRIWDLVNFILALPLDPTLLDETSLAVKSPGSPATPTASRK